jgi:hypothetical protein
LFATRFDATDANKLTNRRMEKISRSEL